MMDDKTIPLKKSRRLTNNEIDLLEWGWTSSPNNIRIQLCHHRAFSCGNIVDMYFAKDMEEAKKLYRTYQKSFKRGVCECRVESFVQQCFIGQIIAEDSKK